MSSPEFNQPRQMRAWYMYDWANSVYSLVIISAVFPVYYKSVTKHGDSYVVPFMGFHLDSSVLYSYALSFSFLVVACLLPFLSGIADVIRGKMAFMKFFVVLGSLSCMGLYFFQDAGDVEWAIACSILASIGYSGSLVFYDAFLPEIVTPDRYDKTSAIGYSMGYLGGVVLLVICLAFILNPIPFGFSSSASASRFAFLLTGLWWICFSLIPFRILRESGIKVRSGSPWSRGYQELGRVWKDLADLPELKKYLWAFFFFNMGVQTVMYMATLFGTDVLNLGDAELIGTVLVIQLVAVGGATVFARVSRKYGNKMAMIIMIGIWVGICLAASQIATAYQFYALAFAVGLVMGGIQSLSRATYAKLIPSETNSHASYFSFYDVTYNLSIVFGTFSYGYILSLTGTMRNSALALGVFFIVGMILLIGVRSPLIEKQ